MGTAVKADCTISFIGLNTGLLTGAAPACTGELHFADLDITAELATEVAARARRISLKAMSSVFPVRFATDHKGDCGHVLVVGGSPGSSGAAAMAAAAACRAGAGLCSVATQPETVAAITSAAPELMVHGLGRPELIKPLVARTSVVVLGPGLGQSLWSQRAFASVTGSNVPIVLDADGLNILADNHMQRSNWVLTPHPGEAARLLDVTTAQIQSDRLAAAEAIARQFGGVCVLKGAGTVVAQNRDSDFIGADKPGCAVSICDAGSAAMASGGMGDVLAGVIGALVAQGMALLPAAELGVAWHAAASDRLSGQGLAAGQLASDLIEQLPHLRSAAGVSK